MSTAPEQPADSGQKSQGAVQAHVQALCAAGAHPQAPPAATHASTGSKLDSATSRQAEPVPPPKTDSGDDEVIHLDNRDLDKEKPVELPGGWRKFENH